MEFISITQYFHRLNIVVLLLQIVPLLTFIVVHFLGQASLIGLASLAPEILQYLLPALAVGDVIVAWLIFRKRLEAAQKAQGLGAKLDRYYALTVVRYGMLSSAALVLAAGYYFYQTDAFTALYVGVLVVGGVAWPSPRKVASDLMLKGDEHEMVYFKKDSF